MMTPHAQNLALAKLDGWKPQAYGHNLIGARISGDFQYFKNGVACAKRDLPRYTESLDALRPILLKLSKGEMIDIFNYLSLKSGHDLTVDLPRQAYPILRASAAQLAEAILRAVGKYT